MDVDRSAPALAASEAEVAADPGDGLAHLKAEAERRAQSPA